MSSCCSPRVLTDAVVLAPLTKGGNLPYRRLCVALGARVTMSEMTVARRLKQRRRGEYALIRRAPDEPFFGVQLAGTNPEEMGWAAALVESRGADLVDLNVGCPIDYFTSKGLGAALSRQPARIGRIVEAMKRSVERVPVTVKIRLGWNERSRNHVDQARAAVDGGADAIVVHGRTGMPAIDPRPTGMRSAKWLRPCRSRWSAMAISCSLTRSPRPARVPGAPV